MKVQAPVVPEATDPTDPPPVKVVAAQALAESVKVVPLDKYPLACIFPTVLPCAPEPRSATPAESREKDVSGAAPALLADHPSTFVLCETKPLALKQSPRTPVFDMHAATVEIASPVLDAAPVACRFGLAAVPFGRTIAVSAPPSVRKVLASVRLVSGVTVVEPPAAA